MTELDRLMGAVDGLASAMKAKLERKYLEGWTGWDDELTAEGIVERARNHLSRIELGDPFQDIDVANFMAFHFALRETQHRET